MVAPQDRDIFFISARRAINASRDAVRTDESIKRFESEFLLPLHGWCEAHRDRVSACYLPLPTGSIRVFVLSNRGEYDFELGKAVAALELNLARAGWRVSISLIPSADDDTLGTFFTPENTLEVYAKCLATSAEGGV